MAGTGPLQPSSRGVPMSESDVTAILVRLRALEDSFESLGKRLGFMERTLYTFAGGVGVIAFLIGANLIQIGAQS